MKFRPISCLVLILTFGHYYSEASELQKTIVTDINANKLICAIVEKHNIAVAIEKPYGGSVTINKNTSPTETISMLEQNIENRGRQYSMLKNGQWIGSIQIGVFSDPNSAVRIFKDHIRYTAMGPNKDLSNELSDKSVGWWEERYKGFARILFIRENVVVSIYFTFEKLIPAGMSSEITMEIAKTIDNSLAQGTLGVKRGAVLNVPRIMAVETPAKIVARTQVEAKLRIAVAENPKDPNSKEVEIVRTLPFHVPLANETNNKLTYEVTYITAGCVVTSKQVALTVTPAAIDR